MLMLLLMLMVMVMVDAARRHTQPVTKSTAHLTPTPLSIHSSAHPTASSPEDLGRHVAVRPRFTSELVDLVGGVRHLAVAVDGHERLGEAKVCCCR